MGSTASAFFVDDETAARDAIAVAAATAAYAAKAAETAAAICSNGPGTGAQEDGKSAHSDNSEHISPPDKGRA